MNRSKKMTVRLFTLVVICVGLADGLGAKIFSNYYNEVFHITAVQRGFLEIPRESPGILCMLLVAALYLGSEIADGLTKTDNVSHLTHIVGGVCGIVFGFRLARAKKR